MCISLAFMLTLQHGQRSRTMLGQRQHSCHVNGVGSLEFVMDLLLFSLGTLMSQDASVGSLKEKMSAWKTLLILNA
jgi:hypothetical protein